MLVLDDMHWADKPTLLLLRHLLRSATPMRLLVLATYRDTDLDRIHPLAEVLADLRRQPGVDRLDLAGLDEAEVTELMDTAAGHDLDEPGVELARARHTETEGNPFFVGEVLRHLAESGAIVQRDGRWTSDNTLDEVGIPEGIREVVGRRLSRLSDAVNRGARDRRGDRCDVRPRDDRRPRADPRGDELFDALDEAVRHSVDPRGARRGRPVHVRARARAVGAVRGAHDQPPGAHALAGRRGDRDRGTRIASTQHLDELAYHFGEGALAGDPLKAVEYCRRAGERADAELAFEAAAKHYERALGSLELVDDGDPVVRVRPRDRARDSAARRGRRAPARTRRSPPPRARGDRRWRAAGRAAMILCAGGGTSDAPSTPSSSRCSRRRSPRWATSRAACAPDCCRHWRPSCNGDRRSSGACGSRARRSRWRGKPVIRGR